LSVLELLKKIRELIEEGALETLPREEFVKVQSVLLDIDGAVNTEMEDRDLHDCFEFLMHVE